MSSTLVDLESFATFSSVDISQRDPNQLVPLFTIAHGICADFLGFDPAVQTHSEEGALGAPIYTGRDSGNLTFRLKHKPTVSSYALPSQGPYPVFTAINLLFPAPFPSIDLFQAAGAMNAVVVRQNTATVYVPYLGAGGLPAVAFQYGGGSMPTMSATGYSATYTAGYAITTYDATAYPTALPVPVTLRKACALVVEVLLAQGDRLSNDLQAAIAGTLRGFKNLDYAEQYETGVDALEDIGTSILHGTQQGKWAKQLMMRYARTSAGRVMVI